MDKTIIDLYAEWMYAVAKGRIRRHPHFKKQVAEKTGCSISTVNNWLTGRNRPPLTVRIHLANHYGGTPESIAPEELYKKTTRKK